MPPSRWCPTPEQLMILEELYRRGLRTPNASQIQKITAQLAFYGKIQGKNVFYWFQNHKARDRQKLRKKLAKELHQHHLMQHQLLLNPQMQYTHIMDFQQPQNHPFLQLPNCCSPQHVLPQPQGSGVSCDEGSMRQTWMMDLPKDMLMRTYGHDSMMIMEVGPTLPCCRTKPLETLQLFPLTSADDQKKKKFSDDQIIMHI